MDTEFAFLRELETDLTGVARAEQRRMASPAKTRRRRPFVRAGLGVAAAVLALAFGIGVLAQGAGVRSPEGGISLIGVGSSSATEPAAAPAPGPNPSPGTGGKDTQGKTHQQGAAASTDLSKIIRDGAIAVTIPNGSFSDQFKRVVAIAGANGGSVLSSTTSGGDSGTFTLRVPAANFDKALLQLRELGTVDSSAVQGQDVTADYIDSKAHLQIYTSRRAVLYGLMGQATTIGQTLVVQNQLEQVQLKIDQITGQLRYLDNQVAESTIKVDIHEPDAAVATSTSDDIRNPSLGRAFDRAVQGVINILAAVMIGLGYLLPLLVIGGGVYLVVWAVRRRSRRTAAGG